MSSGEKAIIYARVSTDDKDQDPERQIPDCQRYAEQNDFNVVEIVREHHTGDSDPWSRPKLSKALQEHSPDAVIFQEVDRWSRQHPMKVMRTYEYANDQGIKLISATEPHFNLDSEWGDALLYLQAKFNNWYLSQLKKKIKSGMEQARREGKKIGRPEAKFNKPRAFHLLFNEDKSLQEVADEVGVSKSTVYRFKRDVEKDPESFKKELGVA